MKKLLNFRPFVFIAVSLCFGIATAYFFMRKMTVWGIFFPSLLLFSLVLYIFLYTNKCDKRRSLIFALVFILSFFIGGASFLCNINAYEGAKLNNHYYNVTGKVTYCVNNDGYYSLTLNDVSVIGNVIKELDYGVSLEVYGNGEYEIGDIIEFNAHLIDKSYIYEDKFNSYEVEAGIKYSATVSVQDVTVKAHNPNVFEKVNLFLRDSLKKGLDEKEFGVGYAMLVGNSDYMNGQNLSAYRIAGVAHIFAVSGLHIGFLATALSFILNKLKVKRLLKAFIVTSVLIFYSGICGFSASALRATVMTAVMLFSAVKGERYDGLTATAFAAIIILLFSPLQLFSVGFQLSFAVVIGLNLLSKPIADIFKFLPKIIANGLGTVISAQVFTIPIMLYAFGEFSWISVMANLIFIPFVSPIFIYILSATVLGGISGISRVLLFPLNYVLKFVNLCISAFDNNVFMLGGFLIGGGIIAYYLSFIIISGLVNLKKVAKIAVSITLGIICVFTSVLTTLTDKNTTKIYISGSENLSATFIDARDENVLIISDVSYIFSVARLNRIVYSSGGNIVDTVVFMGGYSADMQVCLTKLSHAFNIKSICYYGEKEEDVEKVIEKSFGIKSYNFSDGKILPIKSFACQFALNGKALKGVIKDKSAVIFSAFGADGVNLNDIKENFDIAVCLDSADAVLSTLNAEASVSFRGGTSYVDAETQGNFVIKLN